MDDTAPLGLAARLKRDTRELHTQAERSGLMAGLLRGRISRPAYCALLRNLQPIYAALEAGLDAGPEHPGLWGPQLRRLPAIEQDLTLLHPGDWRSELAIEPATAAYVQRLRALAAGQPALLLAHAYLRYLGDLHGGQMLARIVRQCFALDGEPGCAFYSFGDAAQVERLKRDFRAGLDALGGQLTPPQQAAFVAEACEAFRLHQQLFEQLQQRYPDEL